MCAKIAQARRGAVPGRPETGRMLLVFVSLPGLKNRVAGGWTKRSEGSPGAIALLALGLHILTRSNLIR